MPKPQTYLDLIWNDRAYVRAVDGSASYIQPPLDLPAGNTLVYLSYSPLVISAPTVPQRFGVKSFDIACHFSEGTEGQDCIVTILGRRDPYDGDGLPNRVTRTITIPNPGSAATRSLLPVNLGNDFTRLWYFSVSATIGGEFYSASIATDNIVFERQSGGKDCTANGLKTLNVSLSFVLKPGHLLIPPYSSTTSPPAPQSPPPTRTSSPSTPSPRSPQPSAHLPLPSP